MRAEHPGIAPLVTGTGVTAENARKPTGNPTSWEAQDRADAARQMAAELRRQDPEAYGLPAPKTARRWERGPDGVERPVEVIDHPGSPAARRAHGTAAVRVATGGTGRMVGVDPVSPRFQDPEIDGQDDSMAELLAGWDRTPSKPSTFG